MDLVIVCKPAWWGTFKSDYRHGCAHGRNVCVTIHEYIYVWAVLLFANQRGGALQIGFQTRPAT